MKNSFADPDRIATGVDPGHHIAAVERHDRGAVMENLKCMRHVDAARRTTGIERAVIDAPGMKPAPRRVVEPCRVGVRRIVAAEEHELPLPDASRIVNGEGG